MPIEPASTEASSVRMSPNMFSVTTTSSVAGLVTSRMAAVSTSMWSSATSGFRPPISVAICRHSRDDSSTFALSTEVTFFLRAFASRNASSTTRRISKSQYSSVSNARSWPSLRSRPFGWPK